MMRASRSFFPGASPEVLQAERGAPAPRQRAIRGHRPLPSPARPMRVGLSPANQLSGSVTVWGAWSMAHWEYIVLRKKTPWNVPLVPSWQN